MIVAFRLDASLRVGSGHLARSLALADALVETHGAECTFVAADPDGIVAARLAGSVHRLIVLPSLLSVTASRLEKEQDAQRFRRELAATGITPDWVIVDHYGIDAEWLDTCDTSAARLAIDDLANRSLPVDLVVDPTPRDSAWRDYAMYVCSGTRLLSGPRFALLRDEFRIEKAPPHKSQRVFVSFGGGDEHNWTLKALHALSLLTVPVEVDIVVPSQHSGLAELRSAVNEMGGTVRLHVDHPRISALMCQAVLALGAGGTMSWERCACGLPALAWSIAANQDGILAALEKANAAAVLEAEDAASPSFLAAKIKGCLDDARGLAAMSVAARGLCDGKGVMRVVDAMRNHALELRDVTIDDAEKLLAWRNDVEVRMARMNQQEITPQEHADWLARSLDDGNRVLLVGRLDENDVGVLRYDVDDQERSAEVSIYLAPNAKERGIGSALLARGEAEIVSRWPLDRLKARIRHDNQRSLALFERGGFSQVGEGWEKRLPGCNRK